MNDPLSDVLRSVRLIGGVFLDAHFTAPWCVTAHMDAGDCRPYLDSPAQLIGFHVVTEGRLLLSLDDHDDVEMRAGEIVLLMQNEGHTLASAPGLVPIRAGTLLQPAAEGGLARIRHGGNGEATRIICGFLGSEDGYNPAIAALPRLLTLDLRDSVSRDWIEASVRFAAGELVAGRLASSTVMSRLSETLLVEAVRQYSSTLTEDQRGWLKGLKDPQIGRALALMHQSSTEHWTAAGLANAVAMSRSAFIERFTALVGLPPIRYLTVCRLQSARALLQETRQSISQLAQTVGYESDEAFSRAFKREFGLSPVRWREQGM